MAKINKNEIKQILDKIELTSQDRAKLAEYISQAGNEVPEEFKNWSGAANFLNNNNEPGGMIAMPFGYHRGQYFEYGEVNVTTEYVELGDFIYESARQMIIFNSNVYGTTNIGAVSNILSAEIATGVGLLKYENGKLYYRGFFPQGKQNISVRVCYGINKLTSEWVDLESDRLYGNVDNDQYNNLQTALANGKYDLTVYFLIRGQVRKIYAHFSRSGDLLSMRGIYIDNHIYEITFGEFRITSLKVGQDITSSSIAYKETIIPNITDYEEPHLRLYIGEKQANLNILSEVSLTKTKPCDIINLNHVYILQNAEYYNGTITGIKEGKLVQYNVNLDTGEITQKLSIDLELIGSEVKLDVCSAGSTEAARNLELLNKAYFALGDHFTVNIDAGIGVAKFIPESGGEGHITTAAGVNVHYTIGVDGSVTKTMEIDIVELYNKVEAITITVDE